MSGEKTKTATRPYRKRRRAEQEEQTRLRITEAAMELHRSIGPARTTISAVAERAGVQRATLYRHFADEEAVFAACSSHWAALNPRPDLTVWSEIDDPDERLRVALGELYRWYAHTEQMLANVIRDRPLVPALRRPAERFLRWYEDAGEVLMRGRPTRGARRRRTKAAIGHALAFETWASLAREQGLSERDAIELMAGLIAAAGAARDH
ncbi:MAG: TetR/AcrR family transcriptional regulator [Solirubrobacterales bacterium]